VGCRLAGDPVAYIQAFDALAQFYNHSGKLVPDDDRWFNGDGDLIVIDV
jgi:hypothetical protein